MAIDPTEIIDFYPKSFRKMIADGMCTEEEALSIQVRFLHSKEYATIKDRIVKSRGFGKTKEEFTEIGQLELAYIEQGLRGWKNLQDRDGNAILFDSGVPIMKNIDKVPPTLKEEVSNFIAAGSELSDDEAKN